MTNDLPPMPDTPPTVVPKPSPGRRRNLIVAAAVAAALAVGGTVYWVGRPSYDDIVKECQRALVAQYKADGRGKPAACTDVKGDDYDVLVLNAAMGNLGWLDDDGEFDKDKMLEGSLGEP